MSALLQFFMPRGRRQETSMIGKDNTQNPPPEAFQSSFQVLEVGFVLLFRNPTN